MSGPLADIITTATNNNTTYCLDNFFDNKPPPPTRWRANPPLTLESGWLSDHPGTQLLHCPLALSNHWVYYNRRPGPRRPRHTQGNAALLFSHCSKLHPTGWKHHTRTSQSSYQCPSPRTWPTSISSSYLTPQTRHSVIYPTLCWQGRWADAPV